MQPSPDGCQAQENGVIPFLVLAYEFTTGPSVAGNAALSPVVEITMIMGVRFLWCHPDICGQAEPIRRRQAVFERLRQETLCTAEQDSRGPLPVQSPKPLEIPASGSPLRDLAAAVPTP